MAHYKQVREIKITGRTEPEREAITLLNRYAELRDETVHSTLQEFLAANLPGRIKRLEQRSSVGATKDHGRGKRAPGKPRTVAGS